MKDLYDSNDKYEKLNHETELENNFESKENLDINNIQSPSLNKKENSDCNINKNDKSENSLSHDNDNKLKKQESSKSTILQSDSKLNIIQQIKNYIPLSRNKRYFIFWILLASSFFSNFDHGAIPAATQEIAKDLDLNSTEIGEFGSLVYFGAATGAVFVSFFINLLNRRILVGFSFFLSGVFLLTFSLVKNVWYLFINRFFVGFCQSMLTIYIPIWIDTYAPRSYKTIFLSLFQLSSPIGLMLGYLLTQLVKEKYSVSFISFYYIKLFYILLYLVVIYFHNPICRSFHF
jgi:hypothetical protein